MVWTMTRFIRRYRVLKWITDVLRETLKWFVGLILMYAGILALGYAVVTIVHYLGAGILSFTLTMAMIAFITAIIQTTFKK